MGCDGGTIPKRDELVTLKKKPEQKDKVAELSFRWHYCSISQERLEEPIVACALGRLYKKDTIIEKLLDKSSIPETMAHIKGLKDIKDLNLTLNPAFRDKLDRGDNPVDGQMAPYICPVSGLEMNGKFKFYFFWTCGCVLSVRALKQFTEKVCSSCQKPYTDSDLVILNALDEDLETNIRRREERKANKRMKIKVEEVDSGIKTEEKKIKTSKKIVSSSSNSNAKRSFEDLKDPVYKKLKISVSKDPNASEVFKSLFTTHANATSQGSAHWITYNPFYN